MTEFMFLGESGPFQLFERSDKSGEGWRNLKLVRSGDAPKNNWWIAWNGSRMADNNDQRKLTKHHPEIAVWVEQIMRSTNVA